MSTERAKQPIKSPHALQEELAEVADRALVGGLERGSYGEPTQSVPNDDGWSTADVLCGMLAGQYAHGAAVEVHGYTLYNDTVTDGMANVWRVHPPEGGRAIDAVNLDHFRTASEFEDYLLHELGE